MLAYHNAIGAREKNAKMHNVALKRENSGINSASKDNEIINTWRLEN